MITVHATESAQMSIKLIIALVPNYFVLPSQLIDGKCIVIAALTNSNFRDWVHASQSISSHISWQSRSGFIKVSNPALYAAEFCL